MPILQMDTGAGEYPIAIETLDYEVLDIDFDRQIVAFRHHYAVPTITDEGANETRPFLCRYPGLRDGASGIILGVYDIRKTKVTKFFEVHKSTYKRGECTSPKASEAVLSKALKEIKALGLSLESDALEKRKISRSGWAHFNRGGRPDSERDTSHSFDLSGSKTGKYFVESKRVSFNFEMGRELRAAKQIAKQVKAAERGSYTVGELILKRGDKKSEKKLIWRLAYQDTFTMASGGKFSTPMAYSKGGRVVFLMRFFHFNHHAGGTDKDVFVFSPVFDLPN